MPKIEIYSTRICPFCVHAKILLTSKNVSFTEIPIDSSPDGLEQMLARSNGQRTVPQIFIDDLHIGGFEDMTKLNATGKLDDLLQIETSMLN